MGRSAGTYTAPASSWNPAVNGASATLADWNALLSDLSNALTQSLSLDGQSTPSANLPMGGFKFTGLGAGTATGNSVRWEQLFSQGAPATLSSATTTDIGGQNSVAVEITGTTTITSFGTNYNGPRFLRFTGALILTNGAALSLPTAANITTVAGDTCVAYPNSAGNGWNVTDYTRASGAALLGVTPTQLLASTAVSKAWVSFNGATAGSYTPTDTYNVLSVTKNNTGDYTLTFGTTLASANFAASFGVLGGNASAAGVAIQGICDIVSRTTTTIRFRTCQYTGSTNTVTQTDYGVVTVAIFGA